MLNMKNYRQLFGIVACLLVCLVSVCEANVATGRMNLRPSAGKRSTSDVSLEDIFGIRNRDDSIESDQFCSQNTLISLNYQYNFLQQQLQQVVFLLESCQRQ